MKKHFLTSVLFGILSLTTSLPTLVLASDDYEEVSYDDLVNQLASRKRAATSSLNDPFDAIKIHAGIGLITSASSVTVDGGDSYRYFNGFQLSLGIDLFSPNWASEALIRNFGQSGSGSETRSLREFDLKVLYKNKLQNSIGYRFGAGLGTRYLKLSDYSKDISINDTTATSVFFTGIDAYASKHVSFGLEAGLRSAMVTNTSDKNSMDLTFRVDTFF